MAHLHRLIVLGLLCLSSLAHAALPKEGRYFYYSLSEANGSYDFMAACQIAIGNEGGGATFHSITGSPPGQGCRFLYGDGRGPFTAALQRTPRFVCPDNTVENSSGTCDCQSGYREEAGQCVTKNDHAQQCWMFAGLETLGGGVLTTDATLKGDIAHGATLCYPLADDPSKGCTVSFSRSSMATWSDGTKVSYGTYSMAPTSKTFGNNQPDYSCTGDAGNTPPNNTTSAGDKCSGYVGSVNGVETCVPGTSSATGVDITGGSSTTTNSDGSTSNSSTSTKCTGVNCTTTTTTTTTASNGTTSSSTRSDTTDRGTYCKGSGAGTAACNGDGDGDDKGSFGGSCTAGFTCDGDAIQCAIAKEQHVRSCKLFDDKSDESRLYDAEKAKDRNRDVTATLPGNNTVDLSNKLDTSNPLAGPACVRDLSITVWRTQVSLPFSAICPALNYMGWVLVAIASLVAFRIVSGKDKE